MGSGGEGVRKKSGVRGPMVSGGPLSEILPRAISSLGPLPGEAVWEPRSLMNDKSVQP